MSWLDSSNGDHSMSGLMLAAMGALSKLASSSSSKKKLVHQQIRQEAQAIQQHILEQRKRSAEAVKSGVTSHPFVDSDADQYFLVLKLACDSGSSKLMCLALDIMQKLLAFGYLHGKSIADPRIYPDPNPHRNQQQQQQQGAEGAQAAGAQEQQANGVSSPSSSSSSDFSLSALAGLTPSAALSTYGSDGKLISVLMDTLYHASQYKDAAVHLLVLKVILTCLTSSSCEVHGWTLLQAVTTCFQIYLANPVMANGLPEEVNRVTAKATLNQVVTLVFQRMEHVASQLKQIHAAQKGEGRKRGQEGKQQQPPSNNSSPDPFASPVASPSPNPDSARSTSDNVPASSSAAPSVPAPGRRGYCAHCSQPANYFCTATTEPVCSMECKVANLRARDPEEKLITALKRKLIIQLELCQNDAYYLLRALCRLAVKILPPSAANEKDTTGLIAVESKILSLQLLLSILSNAGPTFRTSKHFISAIKGDLVNCILRNSAASSIDTIFALASSLFISLVHGFKPHLHAVIGPVLDSIYLPYIQSPNSTFEHKYISLMVLHKLCLDPQTLMELFINYDCGTGSLDNTFQKMANTLERVCRSRLVSENWMTATDEARLRLLALEGLVDTIKSMLTWTKRAQANLIGAASKRVVVAGAAEAEKGMEGYDSDEEAGSGKTPNPTSRRTISMATQPAGTLPPISTSQPSPLSPTSASSATPTSVDGGSGVGGGGALSSSFSMQQFQAVRAQRQKLDTGILKFNMKGGKKGLSYLASHGLIDLDSPHSVAEFFLTNAHQLDKVHVGEFMGDEHDFHKKVLYHYTEQIDFRQMDFDEAIRKFLSGFWLPGEAQKIDRMMEKFAEQYHRHNPGVFSSADTAYVLAYSVIMLNTDAHSPMVKYRMSKEAFLNNNRGIDDGKDIDPAFLSDLYDRIVKNEIKMKDERALQRRGVREAMKRESRLGLFMAESQELVSKAENYLSRYAQKHEQLKAAEAAGHGVGMVSGVDSSATDPSNSRRLSFDLDESQPFYQAGDQDVEAVRPMYEILWYPSLATFSVLLEETEGNKGEEGAHGPQTPSAQHTHSSRIIELCLDGYRHSIRLSSALGLETSRLAFVTSLRKFTLLGSTREMKLKNIEAIKLLLHIAHLEGNALKESWFDVLSCISELERLHLFATSRPIADVFQSSPLRTRESDSINSHHVNKIDSSLIDRIFTSSAHLNSDAILDFIKALIQVSEGELSSISAPRVFSMQKLVEITAMNMNRIRVVWSKMWSVLAPYFIAAGTHPNLNVSMYAIDSLRQLAMKFLDKDELAHYQFQRAFFKPFETIMIQNNSTEPRELIVQCMFRMVASRVHNIKSGWKGVFVVIQTGASQQYHPLVNASFDLLSTILDRHFDLLTSTTDTIDECVNCLVAFGCNSFTSISLSAIAYLQQCAEHLAAQQCSRRDKLAAKMAQQAETGEATQGGVGEFAGGASSTPSARSRAASTTLHQDSLSSSSQPTSPTAGPMSSGTVEDELELGLLSPSSSGSGSHPDMQQELKVWFLLLTGLSRMVGDPRLEVRTHALTTLFKILHKHGSLFSQSTWRAICHGVLFPIFDDVRHSSDPTANKMGSKRGVSMASGQSNSESSTPVSKEEQSAARAAWASMNQVSSWRDPAQWIWPANALSKAQSKATATNTTTAPATGMNGVAGAAPTVSAPAPPSATSTPRTLPTLPPKPPLPPTSRPPTGPPPTAPTTRPPARGAAPSSSGAPTALEHSWLATTCFSALSALVELFDHFFPSVSFMLSDVLGLINSCIAQESEDLARIGTKCLVMLMLKTGSKQSIGQWWTSLESCVEIVQRTMPIEIMSTRLKAMLGVPEESASSNQTSNIGGSNVDNEGAAEQGGSSRAPSRRGSRSNSLVPPTTMETQGNAAENADGSPMPANTPSPSPRRKSSAENAAATHTPPVSLTVNVSSPSPTAAALSSTTNSPAPSTSSAITPLHAGASTPPSPARSLHAATPTTTAPPSPARSAPSPSAIAAAPPSSTFPFNPSLTVSKFKVQLWLLDAVFQILDAHFPRKDSELQRGSASSSSSSLPDGLRKPNEEPTSPGQELDFLSGHTPSSTSTTDAEDVTLGVMNPDEVVVGALTCEQLFYGLDLLSSSLSFARTFNANLLLRRRLYSAGFQTEQTVQGRLPQLFLQETRATRLYMHLLFRLIREGGSGESEEKEQESMTGEKWMSLQEGGSEEELEHSHMTSGVATPVQPSYPSYVRLGEHRVISLSLRFLSDYVSKSLSGQLVSLEFSEELVCGFVDNLHKLASATPTRFKNYLSIFYLPLVQLIAYGKEPSRQHVALLFQSALPSLLPFQPVHPFPLHAIKAPPVPVPAYQQAAYATPAAAAAASHYQHQQQQERERA